jgi:exosortase J
MDTRAELPISPSLARGISFSPRAGAAITAMLAVLGLTTIWSSLLYLWAMWSTDALKSIGMVVPAVSFVLVLRAWRSLGWELDGTWWGFALLVATAVLVRIREQAVMLLVLSPQWTLTFPPHSLVMFAYGAGLVLLFGGRRLFRAALFPLLFLFLVNPVPHVFNVFVDLPLQRASAHVARAFAMALGQPLSPDKLRLMFTPEFGMFIAPGCNGIRGAVTMGMIALVAGYLYRFRWRALALVVLGAVVLGYVFNFVRLCVLVLFCLVALHVPSLQDRAENADYLIGAGLFFVAVFLLYTVVQKLGAGQRAVLKLPLQQPEVSEVPRGFFARTAAFAVLAALGVANVAYGLRAPNLPATAAAEEKSAGVFPQSTADYTLVRTWNEDLMAGTLLFHWAEYAPAGGGPHISIGVSPVLGAHDTMVCHTARGEDPIWHGQQTFATAGSPVSFSTSLYNDGSLQYMEATTLCNGTSCGEYASPQRHFGVVWSKPEADNLLSADPARPIPILLRAETIDTTLSKGVAQQQLSADLTVFLRGMHLDALTQRYRRE